MSGQNELTVEERWAEVDTLLEDYKKKLFLKLQVNPDVENILNLREIQIKTLDKETSNAYSYLLMQHSLYIQEEYNYHATKNAWAKHNMEIVLGRLAPNYGNKYTKWEEKKAAIILENKYAKILNEFIRETTLRMETLSFIAKKIEIMSTILRRREYDN